MKTILAIALAATTTVAVPAFADPVAPASSPTVPAAREDTPARRYCIMSKAPTGSIINRKTCMTRAEWMKEGVDPLELMK